MSERKKILIIGPISDFGGREMEARLIAQSLVPSYQITLLSTVSISSQSNALIEDQNFNWSSIKRSICDNNIYIKLSSNITKYLHKRKENKYNFINNRFTKPFFSFDKLHLKYIKENIISSDAVIFCGELSSKWLIETLEMTEVLNVPLLIRTTGTILEIPETLVSRLSRNHRFLVHSSSNFSALTDIPNVHISIIDQTANNEKQLLDLHISIQESPLTYGYIGRFGKEKGVLNLLEIMSSQHKNFIIAGKGPQEHEVTEFCNINNNFKFLGEIKSNEIHIFYDEIDVLIIPSFEEAGPLVGVEAMAAGKLIISTKVGAMPDRLREVQNEFWFDIHNPETLIESIKKIESLDPRELLSLKKEIRNHYVNTYSNQKVSAQYLNQVSSLLR